MFMSRGGQGQVSGCEASGDLKSGEFLKQILAVFKYVGRIFVYKDVVE